jgi:hypothetical protein
MADVAGGADAVGVEGVGVLVAGVGVVIAAGADGAAGAELSGGVEFAATGVLLLDMLATTIAPRSTTNTRATPPPIDPINTRLGPSCEAGAAAYGRPIGAPRGAEAIGLPSGSVASGPPPRSVPVRVADISGSASGSLAPSGPSPN